MLKKCSILYLPINVLLQADGTVRGRAATECIQSTAATFPVSLAFRLKLPGLHFFQCLHCKPVHGILEHKKKKKRQHCCIRDCSVVAEKTPPHQINVPFKSQQAQTKAPCFAFLIHAYPRTEQFTNSNCKVH